MLQHIVEVNDKWDLLLGGLKSACITISLEIEKMRGKALAQAEYVKDVKTGARVVYGYPNCATYAVPIVVLTKAGVQSKAWNSTVKAFAKLWVAIDEASAFDVIDPIELIESDYVLSMTRAQKHTFYLTHVAKMGLPSTLLPKTVGDGCSIVLISLSYKGSFLV